MRTRTSYRKSSKIGAFFKRNWISVIVVLLLAVLVLPWVVYKIQDFVYNLKFSKFKIGNHFQDNLLQF